MDEWEPDPLRRAELELREAETELARFQRAQEQATDPGRTSAAGLWVSYYGQQRDRWRTHLAALRREQRTPRG